MSQDDNLSEFDQKYLHYPSRENQELVFTWSRQGKSRRYCYQQLNIPSDVFKICYQEIYNSAKDEVHDEIASGLYAKALAGNIPVAMFILKHKAGWVEADSRDPKEKESNESLNQILDVIKEANDRLSGS
jgi:hypothetical protein